MDSIQAKGLHLTNAIWFPGSRCNMMSIASSWPRNSLVSLERHVSELPSPELMPHLVHCTKWWKKWVSWTYKEPMWKHFQACTRIYPSVWSAIYSLLAHYRSHVLWIIIFSWGYYLKNSRMKLSRKKSEHGTLSPKKNVVKYYSLSFYFGTYRTVWDAA